MNADFESAVFGLPAGGVTPVMQAPGNKLVVAVVTNVFPARPAELSEVEAQIRATLTAQKTQEMAERKAREALEKAKAAGGDLKKVAQSMGLELKTTQEFDRRGAIPGIGSAMSVMQAFDQPVGSVFAVGPIGGERLVCRVESKAPADMSKLAEQRSAIRGELMTDKVQMRTALLKDSLRNALFKEGKIKIHQDVLTRLVESYRS